MSPNRPAARAGVPASPRVPEELTDLHARELPRNDEWDRVRITGSIDGDVIAVLDVSESRMSGLVAHGTEIRQLTLTDVVLEGCDLSGCLIRGAALRRVELRDCRLSGIVLDASALHDVTFRSCKLDSASLRSLDAQRVVLHDSVLRDADLSGARLKDSCITASDLRGARCTKIAARGVRLHGSDIAGIRDADALRGVIIEEAQIAPFAVALLDALGVTVEEAAEGFSS